VTVKVTVTVMVICEEEGDPDTHRQTDLGRDNMGTGHTALKPSTSAGSRTYLLHFAIHQLVTSYFNPLYLHINFLIPVCAELNIMYV